MDAEDAVRRRTDGDDLRSKTDIVGLVDDEGLTHKVQVPQGMMDDIVRPLWDYRVAVTGYQRRGRPVPLSNIAKVEEDEPPADA